MPTKSDLKEKLLVGLSVHVDIDVKTEKSVLSVPIQAVLWKIPSEVGIVSDEREKAQVVFVVSGGKVQANVVETGLSDEKFIHIKSGLKKGDVIVSGPYRTLEKLKNYESVNVTK